MEEILGNFEFISIELLLDLLFEELAILWLDSIPEFELTEVGIVDS